MRSLVLSDWEVDELVYYRRRGWTFEEIASQYGIAARTAERIYKREEGRSRKDAPHVITGVC